MSRLFRKSQDAQNPPTRSRFASASEENEYRFEQRPGESNEEAGRRLAEEIFVQVHGQLPRQPVPVSLDHPASKQRAGLASSAVGRELQAIREQEGDGAALAHASGMVIAACMFVAFDLKQPEAAKSTVNYWARRLNVVSGVSATDGLKTGKA